jgi:hypothetical protein
MVDYARGSVTGPAPALPEMFKITLGNLIVAALVAVLASLGVLWVWSDWLRRRRERRLLRFSVLCRICGQLFEDKSAVDLPSCPACGARNERAPVREI